MNQLSLLAFEFPPINMLLRWRDVAPTINKVVLIGFASALIGIGIFLAAARRDPKKAPKGARNLAETLIEFIEKQIIMQTMGPSGLAWTPFLLSMFIFIYLCNVPGIIPFIQMPATARMGIPAFMALMVWVVYNVTGIKHQGPIGYFKSVLFPPGVPKALYILVTPIELISTRNVALRSRARGLRRLVSVANHSVAGLHALSHLRHEEHPHHEEEHEKGSRAPEQFLPFRGDGVWSHVLGGEKDGRKQHGRQRL
ncbi:MAG: F0F1 ATP synthase subunit A [Actinobacteria bacterium]|nr:F0F1 ATP synthase subunit A [Actinomycetota bacterium]